jgi:hypothetical protein
MRALRHNPEAATDFLGVLTQAVQPADFFAPKNVFRILGIGGMTRIAIGKLLHRGGVGAEAPQAA